MDISTAFDLRVYRMRAGVRQHEIAARLGVSAAFVSQLETGRVKLTPERIAEIVAIVDELSSKTRREIAEYVLTAAAS